MSDQATHTETRERRAVRYRVYVRSDSWWKPLTDVSADSHTAAVTQALPLLTAQHFTSGIRLEAVRKQDRLTDSERRWLVEAERLARSNELALVALEAVEEGISMGPKEGLSTARTLLKQGYLEPCVEGWVGLTREGIELARAIGTESEG